MENEVIVFKNGELELEVNVSEDRENVWLSKQQMAELFQRDRTVISKHLKNIFDNVQVKKIILPLTLAHKAFEMVRL